MKQEETKWQIAKKTMLIIAIIVSMAFTDAIWDAIF